MRKPALIIFSFFFVVACCFPQESKTDAGSIRGVVFATDLSGAAIVISDAHIQVQGPVVKETRSDAAGNFVVEALPAGKYEVTATAPGMSDVADVTVIAGTTSITSLDLELQVVSSSVTVTADATPAQDSSQSALCKFPFTRRSRQCENQR